MATTSHATRRSAILAAGAPRMLRRSCGDGGSRADGEHHSMTYHERRQLAYLIQPILVLAGVVLTILALTSAL
jgi:hypothetical protein